MRRLFLAFLFVFLLSLTVPSLRARAMPKYAEAAAWTWGWLEGPMTPLLTPWRTIETQAEMGQIITQLVVHRNRGRPPPDTDQLPLFLERAALDSTATDKWGMRYQVRTSADSLYLRSSGPDMVPETEDDIVVPMRYPSPYRRPVRRR